MIKRLIRIGKFFEVLTENNNLNTTNIIIMIISARLLLSPTLDYGIISGICALIAHFTYRNYKQTTVAQPSQDNGINTGG